MKKTLKSDNDKLEHLLYACMWIAVLLYPLIGVAKSILDGKPVDWGGTLHSYISILPFILLFYLNTLVLIPLFLLKGRARAYTLLAVSLIVLFMAYRFTVDSVLHELPHAFSNLCASGSLVPPPGPPRSGLLPAPVIIDTVIAALLIGIGIGIKAIFNHLKQQKRIMELENEQMQEKLDYLKAQLSPHFFMNILNNIHGMVELNPPRAQRLILEMSELMRYVLYDSSAPEVLLRKEIDFVKNYVSLMRSRYSSRKVFIECVFPPDNELENRSLPPLLFISFIENAFKHGISYREESFINIGFDIYGDRLTFRCDNSVRSDLESTSEVNDGGVGLKNTRKRLEMLYGDDFTLSTGQSHGCFSITLNIPLSSK